MPTTTDKGCETSLDGGWIIEWDHTDEYSVGTGQLTYTVTDLDTGYRYTVRHDDGWRIAPLGQATVDMERLIGDKVQAFPEWSPDLDGLIMTLNLITGFQI